MLTRLIESAIIHIWNRFHINEVFKMATISDVAKLAGVGKTTVSRVLNDHPYVSDMNRKKVEAAMAELNYVPSIAAKKLRGQSSQIVGVIVSRITNPFFTSLVDAIEQEAVKKGYRLIFFQSRSDKSEELRFLDMLKNGQVDGIIMCSVENDIAMIESYRQFGVIILCNEVFKGSKLPNVALDQTQGAYLGTKYLIEQGHQTIAYCTGGDYEGGNHGQARNKGFQKAMSEFHLSVDSNLIFRQVHTVADGRKVAKQLMDLTHLPTAVFTSGDEIASGMIAQFLEAGVKVPEDIAVLGYDNQPFAALVAKPLTTVNQPVQALGRETFRCFIAAINAKPYEMNSEDLTLKLVKRESA